MSAVIAVFVIVVGLLVVVFAVILLKQRERVNELETQLSWEQEHKKAVPKVAPAAFHPTQTQIDLLKDALKDVRFRAVLWNLFRRGTWQNKTHLSGLNIQHFLRTHDISCSDEEATIFISILSNLCIMRIDDYSFCLMATMMTREEFKAAYGSVVNLDSLDSWLLGRVQQKAS